MWCQKNEEIVLKKESAEGDFAVMMLNLLKSQLHHSLDNDLFLCLDL